MIRRFPRILQLGDSCSTDRLWKAVEKIARGERVNIVDSSHLWIHRLERLTQEIAKQALRRRFDGHFRFARSKE